MYNQFSIKEQKQIFENEIDAKLLDKIVCEDSRKIGFIPNDSIHLVVTSPPYNVTKSYDHDLSLTEYLELITDVMIEMHRVLIRGGRVCINVANIGRKPYLPLNSFINRIMIEIGFLMRGEIIWNKAASAGTSTAWGSWQSASNPTLRDVHEYILVYSKGQFGRKYSKREKTDSIEKEDFLELTKSIWSFPTASAKKIGHPAPFPIELPRRCIELFSFEGDIVLDPFVGSGTTSIASIRSKRKHIGIDINEEFCDLAISRIKAETSQLKLKDFNY